MISNLFLHTAKLPIKDGERITIFWDKAQKFYFPLQKATRRSEMKPQKRKAWGADKRSDRGEIWMKTPKGDEGLRVKTGHLSMVAFCSFTGFSSWGSYSKMYDTKTKAKTKKEEDMRTREEGIKSRRKAKGISKPECKGKSWDDSCVGGLGSSQ